MPQPLPPVRKTVDLAVFRAAVAAGTVTRTGVSTGARILKAGEPGAADGDRVVTFVFSDASVDRMGDTIDVKGWVYDESDAGVIMLFGHDAKDISNVLGRAHNIRVEGDRLLGDCHFAEADVNPKAETVLRMVKAGIINTVSVGFDPLEYAPSKARKGGIDFKRQELMEISVVPIPANRNAVAMVKEAGLGEDALELLRVPALSELVRKDLYTVSSFADVLLWLGYLAQSSAWEEEYEGDGSDIPGRLADLLRTAGEILVDMTAEEVAEILARVTGEAEEKAAGLALVRAMTTGHPTHAVTLTADPASLSEGLIKAGADAIRPHVIRAGRTISATNEKSLRDAHGLLEQACGMILSVADANALAETTVADPEAAKAAEVRRRRAIALQRRTALAAA